MSHTDVRSRDGHLSIDVAVREKSSKGSEVVLMDEFEKQAREPEYVNASKVSPYIVISSEFDRSKRVLAHMILELTHRIRSLIGDKICEPVAGYEPVHVMIEGAGGSGKSVFTTKLCALVNALGGFAFLRPGIEKFGDDIANAQRDCEAKGTFFMALVMDDLYISRFDPVDAQTIMTVVNSAATPLIIKDRLLAGTVVKPLFVLSTTNNPYPRSPIDAGALSRRVHKRMLMRDGQLYDLSSGKRKLMSQIALFDWMIATATDRIGKAVKANLDIENFAHEYLQLSIRKREKMAKDDLAAARCKTVAIPAVAPKKINPALLGGMSILSSLID